MEREPQGRLKTCDHDLGRVSSRMQGRVNWTVHCCRDLRAEPLCFALLKTPWRMAGTENKETRGGLNVVRVEDKVGGRETWR